MRLYQVETGSMSPTQDDCAFLWLYCMDGLPYAKYLPEGAPKAMPMVLALMRWDGTIGTMGGKLEVGESIRRALARESCEEADFWLSASCEPEVLGTFADDDWRVHSYALEVSYEELLEVRAKASRARPASAECAGWFIVPAEDYRPGYAGPQGVTAFLENNFQSTAKLEFEALCAKIRERRRQHAAQGDPTAG